MVFPDEEANVATRWRQSADVGHCSADWHEQTQSCLFMCAMLQYCKQEYI